MHVDTNEHRFLERYRSIFNSYRIFSDDYLTYLSVASLWSSRRTGGSGLCTVSPLDLTLPRFAYLELHSHNYMRITRMLTSVGLLGLAYLQVPFITAMLRFCVEGRLANVVDSCFDYWIGAVLNKG